MPAIVGNIIVILILAVVVFFAARSVIRNFKSGGCSGDCSSCGGSCSCGSKAQKKSR